MARHALQPLPYDYAALQPWIDERTMRIHHDYHHLRYVDGLNATEEWLAAARQRGDLTLVRDLQRLVAVHGSGHYLHSLFWDIMGPNQGGRPRDELAEQIVEDFGSFPAFKSQFCAAASSLEIGGWVVLAWQPAGQQLVTFAAESPRQDAPWGIEPLLVLDVCEHAYYLQYQNRRAEYVHNWWNTVNWPRVAGYFTAAARRSGLLVANGTDGPRRRQRYVSQISAAGTSHSSGVHAVIRAS